MALPIVMVRPLGKAVQAPILQVGLQVTLLPTMVMRISMVVGLRRILGMSWEIGRSGAWPQQTALCWAALVLLQAAPILDILRLRGLLPL